MLNVLRVSFERRWQCNLSMGSRFRGNDELAVLSRPVVADELCPLTSCSG
jgi:hypothetical protein